MFDITAVGELLIDFTPQQLTELLYAPNPGGAPANVLSAAARLGAKTALVSRVGDDAFGRLLTGAVTAQGIDASGVSVDGEIPTTLAFVHLDQDGERSFSFYRHPGADVRLDVDHIPAETIRASRVFHFGGVSMTDQPARNATLHALDLARQAGCLISYDPNWRPTLWKSKAEAIAVMGSVLPRVDILKVSEEELPLLAGTDDLIAGSARLCAQGISLVLISRGAKGAFYRRGGLYGALTTYDVATVDTTGAGDAFMGAVLSRLCRLTRSGLQALSREALEELVDFANAAGALATTRKGAIAIMPDGDAIAALRRTGQRKEG